MKKILTVVFATVVFGFLEEILADGKNENLIVKEPFTWKIHSISLGYDIKEGTVAERKTTDTEQDSEQRNSSYQISTSSQSGEMTKSGVGMKVGISAQNSTLDWLKASGSASAHYEKNNTNRLEYASNTNENVQRMFRRSLEKYNSETNQKSIQKLHLAFTITFYNQTDSALYLDLTNAHIPVYMNDLTANNWATPYIVDKLELRPRNPDGQDLTFRMDLNTTHARQLVDFMAKNMPTINLNQGNNITILNPSKEDMWKKRNNLPESSLVVLSSSAGSFSWKITKFHNNNEKVTIGEACEAISEDVKKYRELFTKYGESGLRTVSGVPFGEFKMQDRSCEIAFLEYGGSFYRDVSADLLEMPIVNGGFTIHIVNIDEMNKVRNEKLVDAIIARYKAIQGHEDFKAFLAYHIAAYYKENQDFSNYNAWLTKAAAHGNSQAQWEIREKERIQRERGENEIRERNEREWQEFENRLDRVFRSEIKLLKIISPQSRWGWEAMQWGLDKAMSESKYWKGKNFEYGKGVKQNYLKAMEYYLLAAKLGHAESMYRIGWFYENGHGVKRSHQKAAEWYRKAAKHGFKPAETAIERLNQ